jgi:hypothetical protein
MAEMRSEKRAVMVSRYSEEGIVASEGMMAVCRFIYGMTSCLEFPNKKFNCGDSIRELNWK